MAVQKTAAGSSTQTDRNPASLPDVSVLAKNGQQALARLVRSSEFAVNGSFEIAGQLMSFSQMRLEADLNAFETLTACRDLKELAQCQQHFATKAAEQYIAQATKMTGEFASFLITVAVLSGSVPQA